MESNSILYIAAFACAFAICLVTTPLAKRVSIRLNAIDKPKKRGMHKTPIPRLGGIAIVSGFMGAMLILFPFTEMLQTVQFAGLVVGSLIIVALGIVDDIYDLRASLKLCFQIVAAAIAVFAGIRMNIEIEQFGFLAALVDTFSIPVTFLWIIGLTNAVNLIDGLDGLAAGVSSIASISLMVLCLLTGGGEAVLFAAALAGACLGFLPRNFNPAEIIMGDCGATFLGYVLSVTSIMGLFKGYALVSCLLAALVLAFPILDTAFAIMRRLMRKQPILRADRGHLHHRLIDRGISHQNAVLILYAISIIFGAMAILFSLKSIWVTIVVIISFFILASTIYVYKSRVEGYSEEETAEEAAGEAGEAIVETGEEAADAAGETGEEAADAAGETGEEAADADVETGEEAAETDVETGEEAADADVEAGEEAAETDENDREAPGGAVFGEAELPETEGR